jgi:hypothetical protein
MAPDVGTAVAHQPRETTRLLPHFEPIRLLILAAILIWTLVLVVLIVVLGARKERRQPQRGRIMVTPRAQSEEVFQDARSSDLFGEVA